MSRCSVSPRKKNPDFTPDAPPSDVGAWMKDHVWIQNKKGELAPLELNDAQLALLSTIQKMQLEKKPVRIICLKARQCGFSTFIQAFFYMLAVTRPNVKGLTIAHDDDSTDSLFGKARLMQEQNPTPPPTRYSNRKELVFDVPLRSTLLMQTAGRVQVARGQTFQNLHLSELAFYADALKALTGVMQAVPTQEDSIIFIESTANGIGNVYHKRWQSAYQKEEGCEWEAFFWPWWKEKTYRKVVLGGRFLRTPEEEDLAARYSLDDEQLNWRRYMIVNVFNGDVDSFKQEYPGCPEDAFMSSGSHCFNLNILKTFWDAATEKPKIGRLELDGNSVKFIEDERGHLNVYRFPHPLGQYAMGTDVSEGLGQDAAGTMVIHKRSYLDVAVLHSNRLPPDELAKETDLLRRWYNNALCCPDVTLVGQAFLQDYKRLTGRIYHQQVRDEATDRFRDEMGYRISSKDARSLLIQQFRAALHNGYIHKINHRATIEELMTFVKGKDGKEQASDGCHDDLPMMFMLAFQAILQEPWRQPRKSNAASRLGASVPGVKGERMFTHA